MEVINRQKYEQAGFAKNTGISSASIAKLGKGENVNTEVLLRICKALNCDISDIMEFVPGDDNREKGTTITE